MSTSIQTHDSVFQIRSDNQNVVVRVTDRAHRYAPAKRRHLGGRPAMRQRRLGTDRTKRSESESCLAARRTSLGLASKRVTGSGWLAKKSPAAAWAMLVVSRAMSS